MPDSETAGHERRDIHPVAVVWFAVGLVATLILTFIAIRIFISVLARGEPAKATRMLAPQVQPPPPRLQTDPAADLAKLHAAEEAKLHSYGWVDRSAGVIRIPIERAMELTLERGLPARTDELRRHGGSGAGKEFRAELAAPARRIPGASQGQPLKFPDTLAKEGAQ